MGKIDGNVAVIGITDFAQGELGDIVFVDVDSVDDDLASGEVFGSVEAVKLFPIFTCLSLEK